MEKVVTAAEVRGLRQITGLGMMECKELLQKFNTVEEIIAYVRSASDEPDKVGFTEQRVDVLKNGELIASFRDLEETAKNGYSPLFYKIRVVSELGRYSYVK